MSTLARTVPSMRIPCFLAGLILTSCFAPALVPGWQDAAAHRHEVTDDQHPVATQLLSGFDPSDESGLAQGDQVLFRITLHEGEEQIDEWFLRLTANQLSAHDSVGQPITDVVLWTENVDGSSSPHLGMRGFAGLGNDAIDQIADPDPPLLATVEVEVFDPNGILLGTRLEKVVHRYLETGFVTACEATANQGPAAAKELDYKQSQAHVALAAFFGVIQDHEQLREIFWQILRMPTLWSLIAYVGMLTRIAPAFGDAKASSANVDHRTTKAWNVPLLVLGNESPLLLTSLQVVAPRSPRALSAGIVSMVVVRPGDPDTYLRMQLIAARREH